MQAQPVYDCWKTLNNNIIQRRKLEQKGLLENNNATKTRVIYVTPQGEVFHQKKAVELSQEEDLIFLCGHYEGIDERVINQIRNEILILSKFYCIFSCYQKGRPFIFFDIIDRVKASKF